MQARYCFRIYIGVNSNALLTVTRLLDTSHSPILMNKEFLLPVSKESFKSIEVLQLRATSRKVLNIEGTLSQIFGIGDLLECTWLGIVEIFMVDELLTTLITDWLMHSISLTDWKSPLEFETSVHYYDEVGH